MPKSKRAKKAKKQSNNNKSSDICSDVKKPMEQLKEDLSKVMEQLSVTTENSRKIAPSLSDMPVDAVGLIIEKLDYKEQLILRRVSKSLRALVDNRKPSIASLRLRFEPIYIDCRFDEQSIDYFLPDSPGVVLTRCRIPWSEDIGIKSDDYVKIAFDDLKVTLKNPKLRLETFSVTFRQSNFPGGIDAVWDKCEKIRELLESLNHRLSVRKSEIHVVNPSKYCAILPYLKPGVLEKISVLFDAYGDQGGEDTAWKTIERISHLEQWKQAKELELEQIGGEFPMEYATHFKRFHLKNWREVNEQVLLRFRDYFSQLENFEYCLITYTLWRNVRSLYTIVGQPVTPDDYEALIDKYVSNYSIPNSDYYFEFKFYQRTVEIRKIRK